MRGLEDFRFGIDSTDKSGGLYHQEILDHPDRSAVDLVNAFSYAEPYPAEIERAI
jgi:hypothetical protein